MLNCNCDDIKLEIPGTEHIYLHPGSKIRIGRFSGDMWCVNFGWYSYGGNREVCGWYLRSCSTDKIRPLQKPDLTDIYMINV